MDFKVNTEKKEIVIENKPEQNLQKSSNAETLRLISWADVDERANKENQYEVL